MVAVATESRRLRSWDYASRYLLSDLPCVILDSYPVQKFGLTEGMALATGRWRQDLVDGRMQRHDMRASIIPLAALLSAMIEAYLRSAHIGEREAEFELLADESQRNLTGRPNAVILQSGIL